MGATGVVYAVRDRLADARVVALKTMRHQALGNAGRAMFRSEFRTLTRLRHPNLARVYDYGELADEGASFFTMDYLPQGDLFAATKDADLPTLLRHVISSCRALSYLHSRGLIHFDIKPLNILLNQDGVACVVDFGLCGPRPTGRTMTVLATPHYMAPELVTLDRPLDHRCDVYSIGATLYHLLLRAPPFRAGTLRALFEHHRSSPVPFPEDFDARFGQKTRELITRLMAKRADERPASMDDVIRQIGALGFESVDVAVEQEHDAYVFASRFVGRDAEVNSVTRFISDRLAHQRPQVAAMLIEGAAGSGKTQLVAEARLRTMNLGAEVIRSQCSDGESDPLGAVRRLLRNVIYSPLPRCDVDFFTVWGQLLVAFVPDAEEHLRSLGLIEVVDSARLALRLEDAAAFFVGLGRVTRCVLWIDRMEVAPPEVWQFFGQVAARINGTDRRGTPTKLALLGALRNESKNESPAAAVRQIAPEATLEHVLLDPLHRDEIRELAASMLGTPTAPDGLVSRLAEDSMGNPFFAQELLRALVEEGILVKQRGAWTLRSSEGPRRVPKSIETLLERRVATLETAELAAIRALAVARRALPADVLSRVLASEEGGLYRTLSSLERRGLVRYTAADETYALEHTATRDVVLAGMTGPEIAELHRGLASALLQVDDAHDGECKAEPMAAAAHHLQGAGEVARAVELGFRAAQRLSREGQNDQALALCKECVQWQAQLEQDDEQHYALLLELERLLEIAGHRDEQAQVLTSLEGLAASLGEAAQATVLLRKGDYQGIAGDLEAFASYADALERFRRLGDREGERNAHRQVGFLHWRSGNFRAGIAENQAALEIDRKRDDAIGMVRDLVNIGVCHRGLKDAEKAADTLTQALELYRQTISERPELADSSVYSQLTFSLGNVLREQVRYDDAIAMYQTSIDCLPEHAGFMRATGCNAMANCLLQAGRIDEALRWWHELAEIGKRFVLGPEISGAVKLGHTLLALGRHEEAIPHLKRAAATYERADDVAQEVATRCTLGDVFDKRLNRPGDAWTAYETAYAVAGFAGLSDGRLRAAEGLLRCGLGAGKNVSEILSICDATVEDVDDTFAQRLVLMSLAGALAWRGGQYQRAHDYYERGLQQACKQDANPDMHAGMHNGIAASLKAMGESERAIGAFKTALAYHQKAGLKAHEAQAHHALGNLLAATVDTASGIEHLKAALKIRTELDDTFGRVTAGCDLTLLYARSGEERESQKTLAEVRKLALQRPHAALGREIETLEAALRSLQG